MRHFLGLLLAVTFIAGVVFTAYSLSRERPVKIVETTSDGGYEVAIDRGLYSENYQIHVVYRVPGWRSRDFRYRDGSRFNDSWRSVDHAVSEYDAKNKFLKKQEMADTIGKIKSVFLSEKEESK